MNNEIEILKQEAIVLLGDLIRLPSFSKEEWQTASEITRFLAGKGVQVTRVGNNVLALNKYFDSSKPTILLNSHHDTVKPNSNYARDPFHPALEDGKLYGLGSNDAGGCLVALMMTFLHFYEMEGLKYNLAYAATAEEEISGTGGIENALAFLPKIDCALVGEPTLMQMAVAEKGLIVLDCIAKGKAGHAARNEGENAIYNAIKDIDWINNFSFESVSDLLGPVKMSVTVIETDNKAHNVVPARCKFVIDVRVNELYTLEEVVETIKRNVKSEITPRSLRIRSSSISLQHPLVQSGISLGLTYYGSPTTSDKALMSFPALKIGPGDSARSHMADEYIFVDEIKNGIDTYIQLLGEIL
jgi:acetylornithine deacetylase